MTQEDKHKCKKCIQELKYLYKLYCRNSGPLMFIQTEHNKISVMEIAVRYLIKQGYHFTIGHGTTTFFRTCYINID